MRLHKKMARAAPYLQASVKRMVDWRSEGAPELWGGYRLTDVDATVIWGPGATGTERHVHSQSCRAARPEAASSSVNACRTMQRSEPARDCAKSWARSPLRSWRRPSTCCYSRRLDARGLTPTVVCRPTDLRWQIELQFKRWKSLCGFDVLPLKDPLK